MKRLNGYRMRLVLVGFVAAIVLGSGSARADFTFGTPVHLGPMVNSPYGDACAFMSTDGLEFYFGSDRPPATPNSMEWDIWVSTRATIDDDWGPPVNPGTPLNTSYHEEPECISPDGLELYIDSSRPGGVGQEDLWVAKRKSKEDAWETPVNLGPLVNSSAHDFGAWISTDGLELYYNSMRGGYGGADLYMTTRATTADEWRTPINLGAQVNSSTHDMYPTTSDNALWLLFSDYPGGAPRPGGFGGGDIWMITRATILDPWGEPVNLGPPVNSSAGDVVPRISPDGSMLYFSSTRQGGLGGNWGDIYQAPIIPIVDLNGDGIVDAADMCIMIDHWGEYYSLCDIGPTPIGDGIVDTQDLIVLSEYLFDDIKDPTLVAHWALDETEGMVVTDSAGDNNGYALGEPVWQPDGGLVDGALQLDGVDDYVITGAVPNPADGPFSVLAWINGGAPGQVVISQSGGGMNWLLADPTEGNLMTELKSPGRSGKPLQSQTVITDGNWHRIGFVWDGSNRTLYVDDSIVAEDAQNGLGSSDNDLYIGTNNAMEAGNFFSGLIDDVRIYNRAVRP